MSLPSSIIVVLAHFEPLFTAPTWKKVRMLLVGTLLARGRRNVTTVLQQMGHQMNPQFSVFHHVLNRARWSPLEGSRRLLQVLVATFVGAGDAVSRWPIEVTFEESRVHLGVETQRQWSDLAIERSTPCLFGLYSLVVLLGLVLHPNGAIPVRQTAWYPKTQATFSYILATVRWPVWGASTFQTLAAHPDVCLVPRADLTRLVQAAFY